MKHPPDDSTIKRKVLKLQVKYKKSLYQLNSNTYKQNITDEDIKQKYTSSKEKDISLR